jgi:serine/threonine protein kinase
MPSVRPQPLAEGRFQLLEVIGEGGMATVYRAFDQRLQRPRAIKVLSPAFAQRPALRRRFLSEAQTMANLENARVVRIFDMGQDGDRVYIVMELIEGGSLVDRVRIYGAFPPQMAARVTIELCEAIHAAHEASVIHRDIKPHNILLTRQGELRITDFGIAQVQSDDKAGMTRTGAVLGTWGFMAPEQKSNAKTVDARADIYSIGGTLWSLLKNETPPELFMSEPEPEWYEGIPEPLAEVIKQATRYRREDRYPSARAMGDALRAIMPLLPDDPQGTPDLVVNVPERQSNAEVLDTIAQLEATGVHSPAPRAEGTMVPDEPPPPTRGSAPPAAMPLRAPRPQRPPDSRSLLLPVIAVVVTFVVAAVVVWRLRPAETPPELKLPLPTPQRTTTPVEVPPELPVGTVPPEVPVAPGVATPGAPVTPPPVEAPVKPVATPPAEVTPTPPPAEVTPAPVEATPVVKTPATPAGRLTVSGPTSVAASGSVQVTATISGRYTLKLYYRGASGAFQQKAMSSTGANTYAASFRLDDSMADGADYFVAATDANGKTVRHGSPTAPIRVSVQ